MSLVGGCRTGWIGGGEPGCLTRCELTKTQVGWKPLQWIQRDLCMRSCEESIDQTCCPTGCGNEESERTARVFLRQFFSTRGLKAACKITWGLYKSANSWCPPSEYDFVDGVMPRNLHFKISQMISIYNKIVVKSILLRTCEQYVLNMFPLCLIWCLAISQLSRSD